MKVMKTNLLFLFLLLMFFTNCRRPDFPKPGEPTLEVSRSEKPVFPLPWRVVKGPRVAAIQPCTYTTYFSSKYGSLKKF